MDISTIPDKVWSSILHESININFESLSLKILLAKYKLRIKLNPKDESDCIEELKKELSSQLSIPSLQNDFQKIKYKGGVL